MTREYIRVFASEVEAYERQGWKIVACTLFADRQVSVLLMRERAGETRP